MRIERIGAATLYLGDAREIAPTLVRPAALIGDPPYGQRQNTNVVGKGGVRTVRLAREAVRGIHSSGIATLYPQTIVGDDRPFQPTQWLARAPIVLLWGAHKFADRLPVGSWLVWDKVPTGKIRDQGDGEAAWINDKPARVLRIHRLLWDGACVGSAASSEVTAGQKRVHPTQKPVVLMAWCITQARVPAGGMILDPWMGAGSTGIAAVHAGHPFTGIEIEPQYFDIACRRIEAATRELAEAA